MVSSGSYLILMVLQALLAVYFLYTVIAIFNGAGPIPSRRLTIQSILRLAEIKPGQRLFDLGSGDGRILFAAAKQGAQATGFEINPFLVWYTRVRAWLARETRVAVVHSDFWKSDISEADVITVYLVPLAMARLKEKVEQELRPGTKVISAVYPFPDWTPAERDGKAYLYVVP